ncbi:MAG: RNA pyrophosphohydrolase [Methylobacteriaceae bacterium]|nr:RNA pyrophosphohydrolase [Methylobacteriaceae bacterium]MBV9246428.1 RNA pyrophosphohydrolase [Methylobacteriaceae bacterium]
MNDKPYRLAVGVMLINRVGLVFVGRRRNKKLPEHVADGFEWQMPQGGIDAGEDPRQAALRELYEETNVSSVSFLAEAPQWYAYDLPEPIRRTTWRGRYRGQKQKWFAFRFVGEDSEIDILNPAGGAKPEFVAWRWEKMSRLPDLIIPFKRKVYETVVQVFAHLAAN